MFVPGKRGIKKGHIRGGSLFINGQLGFCKQRPWSGKTVSVVECNRRGVTGKADREEDLRVRGCCSARAKVVLDGRELRRPASWTCLLIVDMAP
jgi:hypothetical protein